MTTRNEAWTEYWQSGALHSCVGSLDEGYGGAIGDYWRRTADSFAKRAAVLDIATGNGPLPKLLAGLRADLQITGIDAAAIAPGWWSASAFPQVEMLGNTPLAALAAQGRSFDVLTSQFGWEYIPRPESVQQTVALSAPGARWYLVCHHAQGRLAQVAQAEVDGASRLLAPQGLLQAAITLLPYVRLASTDATRLNADATAVAARTAYNAAITELGQAITSSVAPDVMIQARQGVHQLLQRAAQDPSFGAESTLRQWRSAVERSVLRSGELVSHALSVADMDALRTTLPADAVVSVNELRQTEGLLAWAIEVTLPKR